MDGVILQSNQIKHAAMLDLFAKWPQYINSELAAEELPFEVHLARFVPVNSIL
jgi:hypothetical protein